MRRLGDFEKSLICYLLPLLPAHSLLRHIKAPLGGLELGYSYFTRRGLLISALSQSGFLVS